LGLAVCLQLSVAWLLTQDLINRRIANTIPPWIDVVPLPQEQLEGLLPPPPEPTLITPDSLAVVPPLFDTAPGENSVVNVEPRQSSTSSQTMPPSAPDHAPVSIAATHTVPPYPPIARRLGAEGKVTLRLTVSVEGRVSRAEVVTSSGRDDLDQTAQQWIMAHWRYKPALANGVAAASQTLATVTFSLINER